MKKYKDGKYEVKKYSSGSKYWCYNGKIHREDDLPAVECSDGFTGWSIHGEIHRIGAPSIIRPDGSTAWYLDNIKYSEKEYWMELYKRGLTTKEQLLNALI